MGIELSQRASSIPQKIRKLPLHAPSLPFGDIGWNRNSRSSQLARQAKYLFPRKRVAHRVGENDKVHGFLPCYEISMTLDAIFSECHARPNLHLRFYKLTSSL